MRIGILTVSDLGAMGQRADVSGDAILEWAGARGYEVVVRSVVPASRAVTSSGSRFRTSPGSISSPRSSGR